MFLHLHPEGRVRLFPGEGLLPVYDEPAATYAKDAAQLRLPALALPTGAIEAWRVDSATVTITDAGPKPGPIAPRTIIRTATGNDEGPASWPAADQVRAQADQLVALAANRRAVAEAALVAAKRRAEEEQKAMAHTRAEQDIKLEDDRREAEALQARQRQTSRDIRSALLAAQEVVAKRKLTVLAFRLRLSTERRQQITLAASQALDAGDATLQTFLDDLASSLEVELDREDVQQAVALLHQLDLLTDAERDALVADSRVEERVASVGREAAPAAS